jgi:uroporphyrinogen III methyltransferase/synthase
VVYDALVNPDLLRFAPGGAELIFAGKRGGAGRAIEQDDLNQMLVERARRGEIVVRLKGGDPFIFGRGGEEAEALAAANIPFEIVPGVTSAIAAPAFAGIPLTHRERGSFVAFVTAHEDESNAARPATPWKELAAAANGRGTIVLLMASARMRAALAHLQAAGLPASTPAAAVQWATTAAQKTVRGTIETLAERCERAELGAPAVIVVGECAGLGEYLRWFERMPLFGRRIVVTRTRAQASGFARELRRLGAEVIEFPTIETAPPSSYAAIDRAIARVGDFDWIIFTSATGVEGFIARLKALGRDIRSMGAARLAAIGPATASRLSDYALKVDAMPAEFRAEAIVPAIGEKRVRGARFLIPRAEVAREALPDLLRAKGAREVEVAAAYSTIKPAGAAVERLRELIAAGAIDLVTFTSSSTVRNFHELAGASAAGLKAAAIGPITAETAAELGFEVVVRPGQYTIAALTAAIRDHFAASGAPRGAS